MRNEVIYLTSKSNHSSSLSGFKRNGAQNKPAFSVVNEKRMELYLSRMSEKALQDLRKENYIFWSIGRAYQIHLKLRQQDNMAVTDNVLMPTGT